MLGLSNDTSSESFFPWEGGQNSKIVRGIISCAVCFLHHCSTWMHCPNPQLLNGLYLTGSTRGPSSVSSDNSINNFHKLLLIKYTSWFAEIECYFQNSLNNLWTPILKYAFQPCRKYLIQCISRGYYLLFNFLDYKAYQSTARGL